MTHLRLILALSALMAVIGCTATQHANRLTIPFKGLESEGRDFRGKLTLPDTDRAKAPVVILVHGTAGIDSRYEFHRPALLDAGIGTFEVDFKSGVFRSGSDRPAMATFHPWAFGALMSLRSHPQVDPQRIAIMGFSMGGHLSVSVASHKVTSKWLTTDQAGFAAHVGLYPACQWLKKNFDANGSTGAPILILTAERDTWGDGRYCPDFCDGLNKLQPDAVALKIYPGVHHGFDRKGYWKGFAPYAKNKTAILQWNSQAAHDSRKRAVAFLLSAFGLRPPAEAQRPVKREP